MKIKITAFLLFFSLSLYSQSLRFNFIGGLTSKKTVTFGLGASYLLPNETSDKYHFRMDILAHQDNFKYGVEQRTGVETKNVYGFLFFQLMPTANIGAGLMYRIPFENDCLELGATCNTFGKATFQFGVITKL